MSIRVRRNAAVTGSLLLFCSLGFGAWDPLNSGVVGPLYAVHFPGGTQVGYAVGADMTGGGAIVKTTDGGNTWVPQSSGVPSALNSVYFKDADTGYAVGDFGAAIRTTDGGTTWIAMTVIGPDNLTRVQFPENGQIGYIFAHPGSPPSMLSKTTDGGITWSAAIVGGPADVTRGGSFANDSVGVAVGDSGLVIGNNGYQDAQTNADIVAAAFSPTDPNIGYLIGNDSTRGVIRYTDDGGATPWDSVRCWNVTAFYGVDMPTDDAAYVCGDSAGNGIILRSVSNTDFYRTSVPGTATLYSLCFPNGADTGYAVGAGGVILRTYDRGGLPHWVAEENGPAASRAGIRVVSNPSRHGITFRADADVYVVVFDAAGRVVKKQAANRGLNFLPLSKSGVYVVKVTTKGFSTTQKLVVEH